MTGLTKDAQGDASGIKGTEYHLLYALWLLIRGGADRISFYEGNDLLARPIAPPKIVESDDSLPVPLHAEEPNEDIWIQLKSTESPWTRSRFLPADTKNDNLIKNFICNAVRSESAGRSWRVVLATQGYTHRNALEEFISHPTNFPDLNKHLVEIVDRAEEELAKAGLSRPKSDLLKLSTNILSQLAQGKAVSRERLLAEIELELAYVCYNRDRALQISKALLGALLSDASAFSIPGQTYDLNWVNQVAGFIVNTRSRFNTDPVYSCSQANSQNQARDWNSKYFVPRARLERALDQFLLAPQTLFVLIGKSGSGKSWSTTDWAARILSERMRLLLPAGVLDHHRHLSALVAEALRSQTSGDPTNENLLRQFQGASKVDGRGPGVIIIDDLHVRSNDITLASDLASLVKQCRTYDIKLVFTCQEQVWNRHRLWKEISAADLYVVDVGAGTPQDSSRFDTSKTDHVPDEAQASPKATHSFYLGDFTPDEIIAYLRTRLSSDRAKRAGLFLTKPSFAVLRNPYLLTRYLELHGTELDGTTPPPTVSIDDLLDARVTQLLESVGETLLLSTTDLRSAFDVLIDVLWTSRIDGLSYSASITSTSSLLADKAGNFISELRETGFLTWESPLRIVEQPIADRLFARRLAQTTEAVHEVSKKLQPQEDTAVVAALMRRSQFDPIGLAEELINQDKRWIKSVPDGLAQCDPHDYRVLGFLAALMHSDPRQIFIIEAANALGQLAVQDKRAWRFVVSMYFSPTASDRYGGEYALGSAMEFDPDAVAAAVRLKLSRAALAKGVFSSDIKKKRDPILKGALEPLSLIKNTAAARAGRKLLRRYEYLSGQNKHDVNYKFLESIDRARGRIAIYNSEVFDELLSQLQSDDHLVRYRAACAIRDPAVEEPLRIQPVLRSALLRQPESYSTTNRILLAAYPLVNAAPDNLLTMLIDSSLTKWDRPASAAQVLGQLGDLASKHAVEISQLLPKRLDNYTPEDRALTSEMLSYAWWRCAEYITDAQEHLLNLATPDLVDVPPELVPFALRGAVIAQLGLICFTEGGANELAGEQHFYPFGELVFTYLNTRRFMRHRAATILAHPSHERLRDLLLQVVREGEVVNINPLNQPLVQSVFRCMVISLEMLTDLANEMPDPMPLLNDLPRDWRALHMASQLLESGRREQTLLDFTETVCEEVRHGSSTMQALAEREKCLAQLAALKSDHQVALEEHRAIIDDHFFQVTGKMRGLAQLIDAHPEDTLSLLDNGIRDSSDQASLYLLKVETRYWAALLLGRLYARMLDRRVIRISEGKEWCDQVLAALSPFPSSIHQAEYQNVYGCIRSWLNGTPEPPNIMQDRDRSLLGDSHALAILILTIGYEAISQGKNCIDLDEALSDRRGWIEGNLVLENNTITQWSSSYLNYVFPAVRLAMIAVGHQFDLEDPAGRLLVDRKITDELLSKHRYVFRQQSNATMESEYETELNNAISDFQAHLERTPRDETLWNWYGDALLRAHRFDEAENAFARCLALPSCSSDMRASGLYGLACVKARLGLESECRQLLIESNSLRELDKAHAVSDPDLELFRERDWFKSLVSSN